MRAKMQLSSIKLPAGCSLRVVAMMISATDNNGMVEIDVKLLIFTDMLVRRYNTQGWSGTQEIATAASQITTAAS